MPPKSVRGLWSFLHSSPASAICGIFRGFLEKSFDVVISCSVLEHLTVRDQEIALNEVARVLKPSGLVGLTFDYGPPAPGANEHLPPPHDPPPNAAEALRRYSQGGLAPAGDPFSEDPIPGSLFRHETIRYTIAALFLAKGGHREPRLPRCERAGTALDHLVIRELPYRVYNGLASTNALIEKLGGAAAQLERIAAERLVELNDKETAIHRIAAEAELTRTELERAVTAMQDRDREIAARDERIAILEATAAERMGAMHDRDREIAIREERITILESTAAERLAAMNDRDREIAMREERIASLEATAAERLAGMQDRDGEIQIREQRIDQFESIAAERLAALQDGARQITSRERQAADLDPVLDERKNLEVRLRVEEED